MTEGDDSTSTLQILKVYIECVIIGRICETDFGVCKNAAFGNAAYIICYSVDLWLSDYKKTNVNFRLKICIILAIKVRLPSNEIREQAYIATQYQQLIMQLKYNPTKVEITLITSYLQSVYTYISCMHRYSFLVYFLLKPRKS